MVTTIFTIRLAATSAPEPPLGWCGRGGPIRGQDTPGRRGSQGRVRDCAVCHGSLLPVGVMSTLARVRKVNAPLGHSDRNLSRWRRTFERASPVARASLTDRLARLPAAAAEEHAHACVSMAPAIRLRADIVINRTACAAGIGRSRSRRRSGSGPRSVAHGRMSTRQSRLAPNPARATSRCWFPSSANRP